MTTPIMVRVATKVLRTRVPLRWFAYLSMPVLLASCISSYAHAQEANHISPPSSELGRDNQSRVAASAAELKVILLKEIGLMVELKRWVARDATNHGQIISDSDLTNDAIFERLESDGQFRAVATSILQKYGYLVPRLNPGSALDRERELYITERSRARAQHQEDERAAVRERQTSNIATITDCNADLVNDCQTRQSDPALPPDRAPGNSSPPAANLDLANPQGPPRAESPTPSRERTMLAANENRDHHQSEDFERRPDDPPLSQIYGSPAVDDMELSAGNPATGSGAAELGAGNISPDELAARYRDESNANSPDISAAPSISGPLRRHHPETFFQPAEMVRKQTPYLDIPSLYDMYLQAITRPATPRRFGSEVFANGTRDPHLISMDLPVGPDYIVGPGDGLSIDLWGGVSRRFFRTVDREGRISLPEAGPLLVSGKSLADVQQSLQQVLRTQFRDVSAEVSLARLRTIRVYEVGDIANPGAYDISSLSTPLNALFAAGGPTPRGSLRLVKHYRGPRLVQSVDLYDLLLHGVKGDMVPLDNGDTVLVPPVGPQVTVEGMVRRPAIYELKDENTLAAVLELAGGLLPIAALRHIEVQRIVAHDKQTMLSLDIPDSTVPAEIAAKLESFEIHDGDRIRIFPIAPFNQDAVYLDGHVIRPGRYSYRAGMRVTDVIASYKDLLPEPAANYAEIIRLNPPDFHPTVESFNLADALASPAQSPLLHPLDTLRIFGRFDFENPPTVSVWGDVRAPGTYRTSGQIRLADAVHLAGGLGPDARQEDAQVFRYLPDGKFKIFSVSLNQALGGDPTENILLQPRDRLLIHRNAAAEQPATVFIQGEVARPGRYPLTTNMTVTELIQVGGGLKPSADPGTADLTHFLYSAENVLTTQHESISIQAALAAKDPTTSVAVHNGDVLTVRQLPGWDDLGASISVKGEVKHPATYGIRPGERLSSILERSGGFQPSAYPYGAILRRVQVRELEVRDQNQMIMRVRDEQSNLQLLPETDPEKKRSKDMALEQWQIALEQLGSNPPTGRVAIRISPDISQWKNTVADVEVRAGDSLEIPKKPSYVMITGQVFNATAVSYRPGKSAQWYLGQSGGATQLADKKAIFVIRADGSVLGSRRGLWSGDSLSAELRPGDTVVVPEKAIGGGLQWQTVFLAAQVASSIAATAFIAAHY